MNAGDLMTKSIVTVDSETSVVDAARTMLRYRVSGLPVVDAKGKLVGILSEGDLLRRSEIGTEKHRSRWLEFLVGAGRAAEEYTLAHAHKVSEVMSDRVFSIAPDAPLEQVVALMERHRVKRLPVLDGGRLAGIVTRADLLRVLVEKTVESVTPPGTDAEIRDLILAEMDRRGWAPRAVVKVEVKDGVAELGGTLTDERERMALRVVAENVPGVRSVVDHLVWIEPLSGMIMEPPPEPPETMKG